MERVGNITNPQPNGTQEISERMSNTSMTYRAAVGRVIVKIRLVCSLPAFDTVELAGAIEAFCKVLHGVVPEDRLNDCYLHAIRRRNSTYPLAVTEIVESWRAILSDETARRRLCSLCDGSGYSVVRDPLDHEKDIVKECPHCHGKAQTAIARV